MLGEEGHFEYEINDVSAVGNSSQSYPQVANGRRVPPLQERHRSMRLAKAESSDKKLEKLARNQG